jgi:uncharacterized membrane protein
MKSSRPRVIGIVLTVFGLVLLLALGLVQSGGSGLDGFAIAGVWVLGLAAVAVGLFMVVKNRRVRTDGVPH